MKQTRYLLLLIQLFSMPLIADELDHKGMITAFNQASGEIEINESLYFLDQDVQILNSQEEPAIDLELSVGQQVEFNTGEFDMITQMIVRKAPPL